MARPVFAAEQDRNQMAGAFRHFCGGKSAKHDRTAMNAAA
jgi:hypothetical protein